MKRLIISVLMLMAATFIFSQANNENEEQSIQQDLVYEQTTPVIK